MLLRAHVGVCRDCARVVAGMRATQAVVRGTPLVPFTCSVASLRRIRWVGAAHRLRRAGVAAVVVVAGSALSFSLADDVRVAPDRPTPKATADRAVVIPFRLPIGQRLARDDFVATRIAR